MSRLATMSRFAEPDGNEVAREVGECACGCGAEIWEGYMHYQMDGEWFYDSDCVMKRVEAERRVAG